MAEARSTKRQKELLDYVAAFIKEHGYGPSYREIMNGIGYKSVSTVAIHINGLIAKGYLRKTDHSARSLEVVTTSADEASIPHLAWVQARLRQLEVTATPEQRAAFAITRDALSISPQDPPK